MFFVAVLSALREIMGGMSVEMMPSAREIALANVVVDIEKGAARVGWDHAPFHLCVGPDGSAAV